MTAMTAAQPVALERHAGLSDEEVVSRILAGELALYEILMRRHNQQVYRAVRSILRNESEADDVVQEAYVSAYRHLATFEGRARFSTWVVRIAVNAALDRRRRSARLVLVDPTDEERRSESHEASGGGSDGDNPEEQSARRELAGLLERAIDALPEPFRIVYVLRELEGLTTEETADSLALEPGTVKTRLYRARRLLRERLIHDVDAASLHAFPFGGERCDRIVAAVLERLARGER